MYTLRETYLKIKNLNRNKYAKFGRRWELCKEKKKTPKKANYQMHRVVILNLCYVLESSVKVI